MKQLFLEDLKGMTDDEIRDHIRTDYEATKEDIDRFKILIAYESVGSWGCDSSSWFLLREKGTNKLFENHGSHCSCYGFEGQWKPEETTLEYLKSEKFFLDIGGYDTDENGNIAAVKEFIARM